MAVRITAPLTGTVTTGSWVVNQRLNLAAMPNGFMQYNYLLPANYSASYLYPVLVYGHWNDGGMNGSSYPADGTGLINATVGPAFNTVAFRTNFPCIAVVVECDQSIDTSGANANANLGGYLDTPNSGGNEQGVTAVLDYIVSHFSADTTRLYATGDSLGGIGTLAWMVDNNAYNGANKRWAAGMTYSDQLYRPSIPNDSTLFERMRNVPLIAVSTSSDNVPASYDQPAWRYYTGNSTYPTAANYTANGTSAMRAGTTSYYYFDNGTASPWNTYRKLNADGGSGTPLYTLLFSFTSGTVTPPPVGSGTRKWYENPGQDGMFWVLPFQTTAQWITSGSQIATLRQGSGFVHLKGGYSAPWVIGRNTDPLIPITVGSKTVSIHIPVGTVTEQPGDFNLGGTDAAQPYLTWSCYNATINTGSIRSSGSSITASQIQLDHGAGLIMLDTVTGQPGGNNAIGGIQDFELSYANADPNYVIQHMLAYSLDANQMNSLAAIWPLKIIDMSFPNNGSLNQGYTIGIPSSIARPTGKSRGFYLLFDNLQQYGWFFYNQSGNNTLSLFCYTDATSGQPNNTLATDVANSISGVLPYACILSNQTDMASMKGMVNGVRSDAYPPPPLMDLTPTGGAEIAPSSFGAYYPSTAAPFNSSTGTGYDVTPTAPTGTVPPPTGVNLVTSGPLNSGAYGPITITATNAAILGSPFTLTATITVTGTTSESQAGTTVTSIGPAINASPTPGSAGTGNLITITSGNQVAVNGTVIAATGNVIALYYIGNSCFQENSSNAWYGPIKPGDGGNSAIADPRPQVTLSNATVTAGAAGGSTVGALSVRTGAGSYTWAYSLSGTAASNFQLSGSNLLTVGSLAAGSYGPFTVTATSAAILGSPFTLSVTVVASVASTTATFQVKNGQILDPTGAVVVPKGVNVYDGVTGSAANANGATPLTTQFPGINWVRLPSGPGSNNGTANAVYPVPSKYLSFIQYCTGYTRNSDGSWTNAHTIAKPIMVCIEDHDANSGNPPYSGTALTIQLNWYTACATYYKGNPYVCFGTQNEMGARDGSGPGYPTVPSTYPASNKAIYDAVRNTGNNTLVLIGAGVGGSNQGTLGVNAGWPRATYLNMTNIVWEIHCYYSAGDIGQDGSYTNVTDYIKGTLDSSWSGTAGGSGIICAQDMKSADGTVPVFIGEYGSDSGNVDGGDGQTIVDGIAAVRTQYGGVGSTAWIHYLNYDAEAWNLTNSAGNLSGWGVKVSNMIKNSNP